MPHHRQERKNPDPIGDKIGGIEGTYHPLAQARGQPAFERIEHRGITRRRRNQLDQGHIAWRIEEMHAAEPDAQRFRQHVGQFAYRQAGGIRRKHSMRCQMRGNPCIEITFPVQALGDGLDHQIALGQSCQMLVIVAGFDRIQQIHASQGCRLKLLEPVERPQHDTVRRPLACRQIEEQHRHIRVGQMRSDLRPHDAGSKHGDLAYIELAHEAVHDASLRADGRWRWHPDGWTPFNQTTV